MIWLFIILFFIQEPSGRSPEELIRLATTRPQPGENYLVLPSLPTDIREEIVLEITSSAKVRQYYEKLDAANRRNVEWFDGVAGLEKERAIWSLLSCLCNTKTIPNRPPGAPEIRLLKLSRSQNGQGFPFRHPSR
jgi:hypothetical protein